MTGSSIGIGRIVSSGSTSSQESKCNGKSFAMEISKLEGFVMGMDHGSKTSDEAGQNATDANGTRAPTSNMETFTAAALLWGRGKMTTEPLAANVSNGCDSKPKSNSPASSAAAALLVGMSMRKEREASTLQATNPSEPVNSPASSSSSTTTTTTDSTEQASSTENQTFDVEAKWREIRKEIAKKGQFNDGPSGQPEETEGLELPKGVTRRPSGAWQAQIYFAGKTRYIGVWDRPQQAATAYNYAKDALKDLKAQQKTFRKRQRNNLRIDTKVGAKTTTLATPHKELKPQLPPSITWPSSASSSSTASSGFFRSPAYSRGPFKKRKGDDLSPSPENSRLKTSMALTQQQQLHPQQHGMVQTVGPLPPPNGHHYSAFTQHLQQQPHMSGSGGNPLTHPALQLLSLRPPQQSPHLPAPNSLWMQPQQQQCHSQQQYQQFPYSQASMANNNNPSNGSPPAITNTSKKGAKNKRANESSTKAKQSKAAGSNDKDKSEKDAQNQKWKRIRAEVVALFNEYKKLNGKNGDSTDPKPTKIFDKDVLRGITVRPSGKFQAQLYFGGRSRYIGVFDSEYEAASAYEMIRSRLKNDPPKPVSASASMNSLISSVSMSSTGTIAQGSSGGKIVKTTEAMSSATTAMRSITPSPTPRSNSQPETTKILTN